MRGPRSDGYRTTIALVGDVKTEDIVKIAPLQACAAAIAPILPSHGGSWMTMVGWRNPIPIAFYRPPSLAEGRSGHGNFYP
ncbi:hypothetical protein D3C87_1773160 [compost metagenome]